MPLPRVPVREPGSKTTVIPSTVICEKGSLAPGSGQLICSLQTCDLDLDRHAEGGCVPVQGRQGSSMRRWGPNGPAEVMPALSHRRWKGRRGADRLSLVTSATEAADSTSYRSIGV